MKVPVKKRKKRRLGNSGNAASRRKAEHKNHVWSWDFIFDRTSRGKQLKWLTIVDEFTWENLFLEVGYNFTSQTIIERLGSLFSTHGLPKFIRSDNGPEFIASALRQWLDRLGIGPLYIEPGSPWENGYVESLNSRFRDELLALEEFDNLESARRLTQQWRHNYNEERPHSSLGYQPPAAFGRQCSLPVATLPPGNTAALIEQTQPVLS